MVGSALALALKDSGLKIVLLDGGPLSVKPFRGDDAFEPRVSALSAAQAEMRLPSVMPTPNRPITSGTTRGSALVTSSNVEAV